MLVLTWVVDETAGAGAGDSAGGAAAGTGTWLERVDTAGLAARATCTIIWAGEILMFIHPLTKTAEGTGMAPSVRNSPV